MSQTFFLRLAAHDGVLELTSAVEGTRRLTFSSFQTTFFTYDFASRAIFACLEKSAVQNMRFCF